MEENVFAQSEQVETQTSEVNTNSFNRETVSGPIDGYDKNCIGHYMAIKNSNGNSIHKPNDHCGCDDKPSVNIDNYIPLLLVIVVILIVKFARKRKDKDI